MPSQELSSLHIKFTRFLYSVCSSPFCHMPSVVVSIACINAIVTLTCLFGGLFRSISVFETTVRFRTPTFKGVWSKVPPVAITTLIRCDDVAMATSDIFSSLYSICFGPVLCSRFPVFCITLANRISKYAIGQDASVSCFLHF